MAERLRPGEAHTRLHALVGVWEGLEVLAPSPHGPGGPAVGRHTLVTSCGGFFVVQDYQQEWSGQVTYRGHGVLGVDTTTGETTWYWVDSLGWVPPAPSRGEWEGDALVLHSHGHGRHARYTYRLEGRERLRLTIAHSDDGEDWQVFLTGDYQRID